MELVVQMASKLGRICLVKRPDEPKIFGGVEKQLVLLTDCGIVCFSQRKMRIKHFIPLVKANVRVDEDRERVISIRQNDSTTFELEYSSTSQCRQWQSKIARAIKQHLQQLNSFSL